MIAERGRVGGVLLLAHGAYGASCGALAALHSHKVVWCTVPKAYSSHIRAMLRRLHNDSCEATSTAGNCFCGGTGCVLDNRPNPVPVLRHPKDLVDLHAQGYKLVYLARDPATRALSMWQGSDHIFTEKKANIAADRLLTNSSSSALPISRWPLKEFLTWLALTQAGSPRIGEHFSKQWESCMLGFHPQLLPSLSWTVGYARPGHEKDDVPAFFKAVLGDELWARHAQGYCCDYWSGASRLNNASHGPSCRRGSTLEEHTFFGTFESRSQKYLGELAASPELYALIRQIFASDYAMLEAHGIVPWAPRDWWRRAGSIFAYVGSADRQGET